MILNLGQRWARQENKAANDLSDRALESSRKSQVSVLMYACCGGRGECTKGEAARQGEYICMS